MNAPSHRSTNGWRKRIVGLEQHVPATRRPSGLLHQPRQCGQHTCAPGRARRRPRVSALLLERASGRRIQLTPQHRRLRSGARDDRTLRRSRPEHQHGHFREEHDRSHQQARLPLPARAAERGALDRDGAPLERPALARSGPGGPGEGDARRAPRRRRRGPPALGVRRSHRFADRERRVERHRLRPANPSSRAQGSRGRRENPRRRRPAGAPSPHRRQAGQRPRASRLRGVLRSQDVCPVRYRARSLAVETSSWRAPRSTKGAAPWTS